jgi:sugar lactone lactonase YvrE
MGSLRGLADGLTRRVRGLDRRRCEGLGRRGRRLPTVVAILSVTAMGGCCTHHHQGVSSGPDLTEIARFDEPATGLAVTPDGRIFISHPRLFSIPAVGVVEIMRDGEHRPYPDRAWNDWDGRRGASAGRAFISPQAIELDERGNTLWVLDPAKRGAARRGTVAGGPKLVAIDLETDRVRWVIGFDRTVAPRRSYLNDVRIDAERQVAYITDSGLGALVVVDLATGRARRRLADDPSTQAERGYVPVIGGCRWTTFFGIRPRVHADGIALSTDREWLYYHALTGTTLYRVPTRMLGDPGLSDAVVGATVETVASTGAVDGMRMDRDGHLYLTALERDAIVRRRPDGTLETVVQDGRIRWPDSIAIVQGESGRMLYFTVTQIHMAWPFNWGRSVSDEPYRLFRIELPEP